MKLLDGKLALVTGAAQGNGKAIAVGLARAGARVIVTDVQGDAVQLAATEIVQEGFESWAFALDVGDRQACASVAERVGEDLGPIAILVNNAGILLRDRIDDATAEDHWHRTLKVNATGPFNMVRAFLPALKESKGCIVNIASIQSFVAIPNSVGYNAAKGAVAQLTRVLAVDLARYSIRVNAIAPGVMATPMTDGARANPTVMGHLMQHVPMGRVGAPEELAGPAVFLASRWASYITGAILPVDGGYLAM